MARLWVCGFELQTTTVGVEWSTATNGGVSIETTTKRSGAAALRMIASGGQTSIIHIPRNTQGVTYYRVYFYTTANPAVDRPFLTIMNSSNAKVGVRMTSGGSPVLRLQNEEDAAQVGSDSSTISLDTWYRLELEVNDTTLSSTFISSRLYAASAESSLLWNPSGTVNLTASPNRMRLGTNGSDANLNMVFDDMAINDDSGSYQNSWCGEGELVILRPDGNNGSPQWTRGGTDSGANWSQVEEFPPDDVSTYVESNTAEQIDEYTLEATPSTMESSDVISWVGAGARFAVSSTTGGDPDFVLRLKSGSDVDETSNLSGAGSTSYNTNATTDPKNYPALGNSSNYEVPGTSSAWTKSMLDSAIIGIRETVTDTHLVRVSAVWLYVDHKPGSGAQTYNDAVSISRKEAVSDQANASILSRLTLSEINSILDGMTNSINSNVTLAQKDGFIDGMGNSITQVSALNERRFLTDSALASIFPALTLLKVLSENQSVLANMQGSVGLPGLLGIDGSPNTNVNPNATLSNILGINLSGGLSLLSDTTLAEKLGISLLGNVSIYPSLTLGRDLAFVPANTALIGGNVALGQSLGLIDVPNLDAQAALNLLGKMGITLTSELLSNLVEAALSLSEKLGITTTAQLNAFPLVGIDKHLFIVEGNNANMFGTEVLSEIRALNILGGLSIQGNVAIPIDLSILTQKLVAIFKDVSVSDRLGISESAQANMQAAVSLAETAGMGNAVNQLLNAGLQISIIGSVLTISGLNVIIVKGFVFTSDSAKNSSASSDYSRSASASDSAQSTVGTDDS